MARLFGGTDVDDWQQFEEVDGLPGHDKGAHKLRSLFWRPRHAEHWKKEEKKQ